MLNKALKLVRLFHHRSQTQLSEGIGLSKSYISEIESGRKKVSMDVLDKYASYFNMPTSSLLFFAERTGTDTVSTTDDTRVFVAEKVVKMLDWVVTISDIDDHVEKRGEV